MFSKTWVVLGGLIIATSLACLTNTTASKLPTPRPTRTAIPTFTVTPVPPSATPAPLVTATPVVDTPTVTPTEPPADVADSSEPAPALDPEKVQAEILNIAAEFALTEDFPTAVERLQALGLPNMEQYILLMVDSAIQETGGAQDEDTRNLLLLADALGLSTPAMIAALATPTVAPATLPPAPPPTATPIPPTPTPIPISNSPVATPTPAEPGTPPGRYEELKIEGRYDCANIGVFGRVKDKGNDNPVQYVTIEVTGEFDDDDDSFDGPFIGKTNSEGRYDVFIGAIDQAGGKNFRAKVIGGPGVTSEDTVEWDTSKDCDNGDKYQVMEINWAQKNN